MGLGRSLALPISADSQKVT